ncbi:MAG: hypothetical protein JKX75_08275 [Gammaproteobacteria bacterium]|nr:hypothetical protein [Gammaproteobacteria bacterium]
MPDEQKISSLYQQGKDTNNPSAHLDDTILKMARDAAEDNVQNVDTKKNSENVKVKSPFSGSWPATASIAAVLIITVILVPLLQQEEASNSIPTTESIRLNKTNFEEDGDVYKDVFSVDNVEKKINKNVMMSEQAQQLSESPRVDLNDGLMYMPQNVINADALRSSNIGIKGGVNSAMPASVADVYHAPSTLRYQSKISTVNEFSPSAKKKISTDVLISSEFSQTIPLANEWLQEIKMLINQGYIEKAREELTKFKKYYPDEEIKSSILDQVMIDIK